MRRKTFCMVTGVDSGYLTTLRGLGLLPFAIPERSESINQRIEYSLDRAILMVAFQSLTSVSGVSREIAAEVIRGVENHPQYHALRRELPSESVESDIWVFYAKPTDGSKPFSWIDNAKTCVEVFAYKGHDKPARFAAVVMANLSDALRTVRDNAAGKPEVQAELHEEAAHLAAEYARVNSDDQNA